jgi:hypothetical protein
MNNPPRRGGWFFVILFVGTILIGAYTLLNDYAKSHLVVESYHLARFDENNVTCDGVIRNTGRYLVKNVHLTLIAHGPDGQVVNSKTWKIDSDLLPPQASSTFNIDIRDPLPGQTGYTMRIDRVSFEWMPWNW